MLYMVYFFYTDLTTAGEVYNFIKKFEIIYLFPAIILHFLVQGFAAFRFYLLVYSRSHEKPCFTPFFKSTVFSNFLSQLLPSSSVLAEGFRFSFLSNLNINKKQYLSAAIIDKVHGLVALCFFGFILAIFLLSNIYINYTLGLVFFTTFTVIITYNRFFKSLIVHCKAFVVSAINVFLNLTIIVLLSGTLGLNIIEVIRMMFAAVIMILVSILPVGIAGFGGQQLLTGYLFDSINLDFSWGVAVSLIFAGFHIVSNSVIALCVYLFFKIGSYYE